MKNFKIIFYEAITGECPIEEFQDSLDKFENDITRVLYFLFMRERQY